MDIPEDILKKLNAVTAKRARTVIQHIIKNGYITTDELQKEYGYTHAPRAARDVRELGIELVTEMIVGPQGRKIGAYRFGSLKNFGQDVAKASGRTALDRKIKAELIHRHGLKCAIANISMRKEDLQIDHRIPYEIAGENNDCNVDNYQLLSANANRQKSWAYEHCPNWKEKKIDKCLSCFWAFPEKHTHVACEGGKVFLLVYTQKESDELASLLRISNNNPERKIKEIVKEYLRKHPEANE